MIFHMVFEVYRPWVMAKPTKTQLGWCCWVGASRALLRRKWIVPVPDPSGATPAVLGEATRHGNRSARTGSRCPSCVSDGNFTEESWPFRAAAGMGPRQLIGVADPGSPIVSRFPNL